MQFSFDSLKHYQRHFKRLVELERREEISFHLNEIHSMSGFTREKKGRAIMALMAKEFGRGLGGLYLVKLTRNDELPETEIGIGDLVILSTGKPEGDEQQATVAEKTKYTITVAYNDVPPSYVSKGKVRLDLFVNDITFQRMFEALFRLSDTLPLTEYLLNRSNPILANDNPTIDLSRDQLNPHQEKAVIDSIRAKDYFLIHGPPGTGKTTTLIASIIQHVRRGCKVLATADSNTAVDNMVEKLVSRKVNVVRIGNPARINPQTTQVSMDHVIQNDPDYQQASAMRDMVAELRDEQRNFIKPTGQSRRGLTDDEILKLSRRGGTNRGIQLSKIHRMAEWINTQRQINALMDQSRKLETRAIHRLIAETDVICSTNSTAGSELLSNVSFDAIFIDEATQSMEPSCLIPMVKGNKWVLAGDHKQLPPTVISQEAKSLNHTLFERWMEQDNPMAQALLKIQYRMHEAIMDFPNRTFYGGQLMASPKVRHHHIGQLSGFGLTDRIPTRLISIFDPKSPVCFINLIDGEERKLKDAFSYYNKEEAALTVDIAHLFMQCRLFPEDLGIISPYEQQVNNIKSQLVGTGIEIKTIDGFQGREKEIILISLVRSNEKNNLGFLTDYRRLNVALTRARRKLVIIGNQETLQTNSMYHDLIGSIPCKIDIHVE